MPGIIRISCGMVQTRNVSFSCRVFIVGGLAQDTVDIRLFQTAGSDPLYHQVSTAQLDSTGGGIAHFDVALEGPCTARLVADDEVSGAPLVGDDIHIKVVP